MDFYEIMLQQKLAGGGGGGGVTVQAFSVSENGVFSAPSGYAYSPVEVSVPTGIFPSGTKDITSNGIYSVVDFASANVNVPIPSGYIQPTGTSSITENGVYNVASFASIDVNVSGGGGDHDVEDAIIQRTISGAYTNSRVTKIGSYAFQSCVSLTTASFSNATYIENNAFQYCSKLTTASFPNVTSIGNYAFQYCVSLTTASFPNVTSVGNSAFQYCSKLTTASFPNVRSIGNYAFQYCSKLTSVYFLASSVVALLSHTAFQYTPMSDMSYIGSFGSIYVPASLVDSYKAANNWSYYADRITAYEGE